MNHKINPGVITGKKVQEVFNLVVIYCIYTFLIKQFYVLVIILPVEKILKLIIMKNLY